MKNKYKTAIIGLGRIGLSYDLNKNIKGNLSYFTTLYKNEFFKLISVADVNKKIFSHISDKSTIKHFLSHKELLQSSHHDVIVVSSPDETHFKILKDIVKYKPLLVICEKPLTNNLKELKHIIKLYNANRIKLITNFSRRYISDFIKINEFINKKKFGKIQLVNMICSRGIFHNGSHLVDLAIWYFGTPKKIKRVSKKKSESYKGDFSGHLILEYKDFKVNIFSTDIKDLGNEEIDIVSDKFRLRVNNEGKLETLKVINHPDYVNTKMFKLIKSKKIEKNFALKNLLHHSLNTIKGKVNYFKSIKDVLLLYEIFSEYDRKYK